MDFNWKQESAHKVNYGEKNSPVYQYQYHYHYRDRYIHPIAYRAILILHKNLSSTSTTVYFKSINVTHLLMTIVWIRIKLRADDILTVLVFTNQLWLKMYGHITSPNGCMTGSENPCQCHDIVSIKNARSVFHNNVLTITVTEYYHQNGYQNHKSQQVELVHQDPNWEAQLTIYSTDYNTV